MQNVGFFNPAKTAAVFDQQNIADYAAAIREPINIVLNSQDRLIGLAKDGQISTQPTGDTSYPLLGCLPALYPEWLGDRSFGETHGVRFAYVGGAMARGITSVEMVIALARSGMFGFFGSAGMSLERLEKEISLIGAALDPKGLTWGANLIHNQSNPAMEDATIDLYLNHAVRRVSAAAFMELSAPIVRYACHGLHQDAEGRICRANYLFGKISHPGVARHFMSPAPAEILNELVNAGKIKAEEAGLAALIPVASDIIVESDSGGHTDNRPLGSLFASIAALRAELQEEYGYDHFNRARLGAAGGMGSPDAVAAAFSFGAAFVLLGTVHQACLESGLSASAKELLANVALDDVMMTPSADMFEMGGRVQVLKKGTMMGVRGNQLFDLYNRYARIEDIPAEIKASLENSVFKKSLDDVWQETQAFFSQSEPKQLARARGDEKHKMALVFRWYLGNTSKWAVDGTDDRRIDYQIWCGPAIGAFNAWTKNTFLEEPKNRSVSQVALNLLEGAASITRAQQLRTFGVPINSSCFDYRATPLGL
ncbi:MAG: PfaD family polyunsaturated fatty acid/polyketide biosynthesis protein [Deltaproteobacteria bacterium]|nr:PfaD family polyunsaturated fatty acid/polyketide biosynthesis protein [Deltaproteobacteria bacterium]